MRPGRRSPRGELGLDRYDLRPVLERLGVTYVRADDEERQR